MNNSTSNIQAPTKWMYTQKDGTSIEIPLERFIWGVVYKDGSHIKQFDENGKYHQIGEVEQDRAKRFLLHKPNPSDGVRIMIEVPEGAKLVHKTKNYGSFIVGQDPQIGKNEIRIFVIGYKLKGRSFFTYVLPDDRIIQSEDENLKLSEYGIYKDK